MMQQVIMGFSRKTEGAINIIEFSQIYIQKGGKFTKTYCKNVDITDRELIKRATYDCLDDKYTRGDTLRLFSKFTSLTPKQINNIYHRGNRVGEKTQYRYSGKTALRFLADEVVDQLETDLMSRHLEFVPIQYRDQKDRSSGKMRRIGIQDVYQQICDYIAVYALEDIFRRFGEYQCASIKGRGQSYGIKAIKKQTRESKGLKYFGKADVKHCFESIDINILLDQMKQRVKNEDLMQLVETLLRTFEKGLSIGSFLSQHLCNLFMSILYHYLAEDDDCFFVRRGKKFHNFDHQLFYMDDIQLSGDNKSKLIKTMKSLCKKAKEIGLTIKPTQFVRDINQQKFVDMMGVKIYYNHTEIRKTVQKRIRRCVLRIHLAIRKHKVINLKLCRKLLSYQGLLKHTDSKSVIYRYDVKKLLKKVKGVVRNESKNRYQTTVCPNPNNQRYGLYQAVSA